MSTETTDAVAPDAPTNGDAAAAAQAAARTSAASGELNLPNGAGLNLVKDIPVTLSIELGRARMTLKELLDLDQGAVVELDRMVDEPLDILVNGTLVAHGEVVVIDDTFGVRLTDVASADGAQVLGG